MDRGTKIAILLAACFSILAGLLWDQVFNAPGAPRNGRGASANARPTAIGVPMIMDYSPVTQDASGRMVLGAPDGSGAGSGPPRRDGTPIVVRSGGPDNPGDSQSPTGATPPAQGAPDASSVIRHPLQRNETLGSLSKRYYGTTKYWLALKRYNKIVDERRIRPGQVILVPRTPPE